MRVTIDPRGFNPLYWHLTKILQDEEIRFVYVYGGSSAAKTYSLLQRILLFTLQGAGSTMALRKYAVDIRDTIYQDCKSILNSWEPLDERFTLTQNLIETSKDRIRFRGLDDSEKLKGISSFRWIFMEELNQFDERDFKQVRKRLRGRKGQQIIGLWNPVDETHWIKKVLDRETWEDLPLEVEGSPGVSRLDPDHSFVKINQKRNAILIRTTYRDNFWIVGHPTDPDVGFYDRHTIEDFENDRIHDFNFWNIYANGEWGRTDTGAEIYRHFDPGIHTKPVQYNPDLPLHLSFDENVHPYPTLLVWQGEGSRADLVDEICLEAPKNNLTYTLTEFKRRYPAHRSGVLVYGDATSRKEDTKLEKGYNFFRLVEDGLREYRPVLRVPSANPSVMMRTAFIDAVFAGRIPGLQITIGNNCTKTIADFKYTKQAADGSKLKEKETDKATGVRFEPFGHATDASEYFLTQFFANEYNDFRNGGRREVNYLKGQRQNRTSY
jgi:hypothetical protein